MKQTKKNRYNNNKWYGASGMAIRCFECNSNNDTRCADERPPADLSIECGDHQRGVKYTFCRKINQHVDFHVNSRK